MNKYLPLVYPLSDALQMTFVVGYNSQGFPRIAAGQTANHRQHLLWTDIDLKLPCTVKGSYLTSHRSGVLVRIKGHLFVYAAFWAKQEKLMLALLDGSKFDTSEKALRKRFDNIAPDEVFRDNAKVIVGVFKRKEYQSEWTSVDLLDCRFTGDSEQDRPAAN